MTRRAEAIPLRRAHRFADRAFPSRMVASIRSGVTFWQSDSGSYGLDRDEQLRHEDGQARVQTLDVDQTHFPRPAFHVVRIRSMDSGFVGQIFLRQPQRFAINWHLPRYSQEMMEKLYKEGRIVQTGPGRVPAYKRYLDEIPGVGLQNDWSDVRPTAGSESLGYPTQKPPSPFSNASSRPAATRAT